MTSKSEKTNAANIENLHITNAIIATIPEFDINNPLITKLALAEYESGFISRTEAVTNSLTAEETAIAEQTAEFKLVPRRVTKIMKAVKGQSLAPETLGHLMTTIRRLRGVRVGKSTPDNPATPEVDESKADHSVSQKSIAGILDGVDFLISQLEAAAGYAPNEIEYKTVTLTVWADRLRQLRNTRLDAQAAVAAARQERNEYCYGKASGIITRMNALKAYVGSILDDSDPRLKKLKSLKFVDLTSK